MQAKMIPTRIICTSSSLYLSRVSYPHSMRIYTTVKQNFRNYPLLGKCGFFQFKKHRRPFYFQISMLYSNIITAKALFVKGFAALFHKNYAQVIRKIFFLNKRVLPNFFSKRSPYLLTKWVIRAILFTH